MLEKTIHFVQGNAKKPYGYLSKESNPLLVQQILMVVTFQQRFVKVHPHRRNDILQQYQKFDWKQVIWIKYENWNQKQHIAFQAHVNHAKGNQVPLAKYLFYVAI